MKSNCFVILWLALLGVVSVSGCSDGSGATEYQATIRYTEYGVPHILADDWGSLGFGQGYSATEDRGCIVADQVLKVRSERASFLGRGEFDEHINSDFGYRSLALLEKAETDLPNLPEQEAELVRGYAAGYNHFLQQNGADAFPGWCAGEPWVRPITAVDYLAYIYDGALMASGATLAAFIGAAQPPGSESAIPTVASFEAALTELTVHASNGWAFGSERTQSGGGMVMTNPQFGWHGATQFRENHLTIPGTLDIYGASFGGFPGIQVGFNENIAWTHTVSEGNRFVVYDLDLTGSDPTRYRYDDETRAMTARTFEVDVLADDGSLETFTRTLYATHYGPVIEIPSFGEWSDARALTFRDANADNDEVLRQFLGMNMAESMDEFQQVFAETSGIPWVNTMAASADGRAWYMDGSATPNLSDEALAIWLDGLANNAIIELFFDFGVVLLDGSDSTFEWVDNPNARDPGLVPFSEQPKLERRDAVSNANQSHWIANSSAPLEGYTPLMGFERQQIGLRPRIVAAMAEDTSPSGPAGEDGRFSLEELQGMYMNNRSILAELLRDDVVDRCTGEGPVDLDGQPVAIADACAVLRDWDTRYDLDSVGAILWRQLWSETTGTGVLWREPFDPSDPIGTPRGLADAPSDAGDPVLSNLAAAIVMLEEAGFSAATPLRDAQFTMKGDERIPMHGGIFADGVANIGAQVIDFADSLEPVVTEQTLDPYTDLTTAGYYADRGPAIVMAIELTEDGPRARSIAAYSQSKNPSSPFFADQTRLYSEEGFKTVRFTQEDIESDPEFREITVEGPRELID
ncbi:MAG: penicillin acylase family protein [Myxococcota bacterium]